MSAEATFLASCPACHQQLTATPEIVGQLVECPFCQHHFVITHPFAPATSIGRDPATVQAELAGLEGQLKENASQMTELRGHVSRLNMELHRHQLRMKTLTDRQGELQTGITAARGELGTT